MKQNKGGEVKGRPDAPKSSGHPVVDRLFKMESEGAIKLTGTLIPAAWHNNLVDQRGMPLYLAMFVLGELVYWHRASIDTDPQTGESMLSKRFQADLYQVNRGHLANKFNVSKKAISTTLTVLENLGLIERDYRDPVYNHRKYRKCVFLMLNLERLVELCQEPVHPTRPGGEESGDDDDAEKGEDQPHVGPEVSPTWGSFPAPHRTGNQPHVGQKIKPYSEKSSKKHSKNNNNNSPSRKVVVAPAGLSPSATGGSAPSTPSSQESGKSYETQNQVEPMPGPSQGKGASNSASGAQRPLADQRGSGAVQGTISARKPQAPVPKARPVPKRSQPGADNMIPVNGCGGTGGIPQEPELQKSKPARFLKISALILERRSGKKAEISMAAQKAIRALFSLYDAWEVPDAILVWLRALSKIGKTAVNGYNYPCCQHSERVEKFCEHIDRIMVDTGSQTVLEMDLMEVIARIKKHSGLPANQVESLFQAELESVSLEPVSPEQKAELERLIDAAEKKSLLAFNDPALSAGQRALVSFVFDEKLRHYGRLHQYNEETVETFVKEVSKLSALTDPVVSRKACENVKDLFKRYRAWEHDGKNLTANSPSCPFFISNITKELKEKGVLP
jgi:DNA-binding transcriptional ArsR family regulator